MDLSQPTPAGTGARSHVAAGTKLRGAEKLARIPVRIAKSDPKELLRKPSWIRAPFTGTAEVARLKKVLRENRLHTVCEEAACPNLGECFAHGTATFMIMGDICTRRCPFCEVGHGRPLPLDPKEPLHLAETIQAMRLKYVVITSVDRDDLRDGGAGHFVACIREARRLNPGLTIEVLTPDFRGRHAVALKTLAEAPPDVFNHNIETVPRLYREARPGSDYVQSLELLRRFGKEHPNVPTKSGLMLGLGETDEEVEQVMSDLRVHGVGMLTLGQYLQPSLHHLPVQRYVPPSKFDRFRDVAKEMGFLQVASGPMVRSSYHADMQASELISRPSSEATK